MPDTLQPSRWLSLGLTFVDGYGDRVRFGPVDPVKYAEAFGASGLRIQHPDEIAPTLHKAFDTPGPVLVGVKVDYRDSVKLFEEVHEGSTV